MKDYLASFEANRKRVKVVTTILIGLLISLMAVVFYIVYNNLNQQIAELTEKNRSAAVWKEKAETLQHFELQYDNLMSAHDSLKNSYDSLSLTVADFSDKSYMALRRIFVQNMGGYVNGRSQITFYDWVPESAQTHLANLIHDMNAYKKIFGEIKSDIKTRDGQYGITIIYMPGFEAKEQNAYNVIAQDTTFVILKNESLAKFMFDPVVRYFHPADEEVAARLQNTLSKGINLDFKLESSRLPAPDRTIEVWIGKINQQQESKMIEAQMIQETAK